MREPSTTELPVSSYGSEFCYIPGDTPAPEEIPAHSIVVLSVGFVSTPPIGPDLTRFRHPQFFSATVTVAFFRLPSRIEHPRAFEHPSTAHPSTTHRGNYLIWRHHLSHLHVPFLFDLETTPATRTVSAPASPEQPSTPPGTDREPRTGPIYSRSPWTPLAADEDHEAPDARLLPSPDRENPANLPRFRRDAHHLLTPPAPNPEFPSSPSQSLLPPHTPPPAPKPRARPMVEFFSFSGERAKKDEMSAANFIKG
ncbi:hypothetical protein FB451DRAFT_1561882 [Mycena latifolia]|nr:hypothetical protein FB451DRAFT_1561882 [Mycena latifolia]